MSTAEFYGGQDLHQLKERSWEGERVTPVKFAAPRLNKKKGLTGQADLPVFYGASKVRTSNIPGLFDRRGYFAGHVRLG